MISYREDIPAILKSEGYMGLYRGFWPTFWRDVPALGLYFYSYDYLKTQYRKAFLNGTSN